MNQNIPKVSIITATKNSERFLEKTIQSVIHQTYPQIEYIIIDGGSTDGTLEIVKKYHDKIDKIISESDEGIYDAFNKGLNIATGDIIYFLNSDDYLLDEHIVQEIAEQFEIQLDISMVYGNVQVIDSSTGFQFIKGRKITIEDLKIGETPPQQAFFFNKHLFQKHGNFNTKYKIAGDFDFNVKCFKTDESKALYMNKTFSVFRMGGLSTDPIWQKRMKEEQHEIIQSYFGISFLGTETSTDINGLYKIWLEMVLLQDKYLASVLRKLGFKRVAIFGTMKAALYLFSDFIKGNIEVVCFLDNNPHMQGQNIKMIRINEPSWLSENKHRIDAIILSIESNRDLIIKEQLIEMIGGSLPIYSWKDLIKLSQQE